MDLEGQDARRATAERGYAMAALLVAIAVMAVMMSVAMPVWRQEGQREKEAELVFRGEQYARAVGLYQRKFPGAFPPNLDVLVQQRFLRKKYKDPMTEDGEFDLLYAGAQALGQPQGGQGGARSGASGASGQGATSGPSPGGVRGGIRGVASKSKEASIKLYKGRGRYNEWQFIFAAVSIQPGGGAGMPGMGRPGGIDPRTGRPMGPGGVGPGGMGPGGMGPGGRPGDPRREMGPGGQPRPPGRPPGRLPE